MKRFLSIIAIAVFGSFWLLPVTDTVSSSVQAAVDYKRVRVQVIVLKTKAEADAVRAKLSKGQSFYSLAKKYSIVDTGKKGGDCGYLEKAQVDKDYPEFSQLAQTAAIGTIAGPTKTRDGWSIVKLIARTY